jgi:hypothetical protein
MNFRNLLLWNRFRKHKCNYLHQRTDWHSNSCLRFDTGQIQRLKYREVHSHSLTRCSQIDKNNCSSNYRQLQYSFPRFDRELYYTVILFHNLIRNTQWHTCKYSLSNQHTDYDQSRQLHFDKVQLQNQHYKEAHFHSLTRWSQIDKNNCNLNYRQFQYSFPRFDRELYYTVILFHNLFRNNQWHTCKYSLSHQHTDYDQSR